MQQVHDNTSDTVRVDEKKVVDTEHYEHGSSETAAHLAHQQETEETPISAFRNNKTSCAWIAYAVWILIACSFDNQASGSILAIPQFRKDFGFAFGGDYVLPAKWLSAYNGGPAAASVIGAFGAGCRSAVPRSSSKDKAHQQGSSTRSAASSSSGPATLSSASASRSKSSPTRPPTPTPCFSPASLSTASPSAA